MISLIHWPLPSYRPQHVAALGADSPVAWQDGRQLSGAKGGLVAHKLLAAPPHNHNMALEPGLNWRAQLGRVALGDTVGVLLGPFSKCFLSTSCVFTELKCTEPGFSGGGDTSMVWASETTSSADAAKGPGGSAGAVGAPGMPRAELEGSGH